PTSTGPTTTASAAVTAPSLVKRDQTPRRRRLIGVSTKMYFSAARTEAFTRTVVDLLSSSPTSAMSGTLTLDDIDVFIIPDFITVTSVIAAIRSSPDGSLARRILVGAQDCYSEDFGAYTGEVSPAVLKEVGVRFVELGHAERKRLGVVRNGMVPLICVGELEK
ncbi:Triosephosphate isomerase, partial [Apiosordaria backusii]